ncbi:hypothetical protein E2C01_077543 [Portunus trituberculatus]|uniref:Uncharacterized protein n=1 Tax=Portunus trituberculatus TaxID=210409 RepID=A0A5B7IMD4_PORTR|nr:hypothetical protein [Portunus trituberculatus]
MRGCETPVPPSLNDYRAGRRIQTARRLPRGEMNPSSETITVREDESKQRDEYRPAWIRHRAASRIPLSGKSSAAPAHAQVLGFGFGLHGSTRPSNRIREYIKSRILPSSSAYRCKKDSLFMATVCFHC